MRDKVTIELEWRAGCLLASLRVGVLSAANDSSSETAERGAVAARVERRKRIRATKEGGSNERRPNKNSSYRDARSSSLQRHC